jgi:hypothetical protein
MGRLLVRRVRDLIEGSENKGTRAWRSSYHSIKVNRRRLKIDRKIWELRGGFVDLVNS